MKKRMVLAVAAAALVGALAGCSSGASSETTTAGAAKTEQTTAAPGTEKADVTEKEAGTAEGGAGAAAEAASKDEPVEIIYVAHGLEDMFCNWLVSCVGEQIEADYPNYHMQVLDGKLSADVQAEQLENAIAMKPDLIFYSAADYYACTPIIRQAQDAGIPVIMIQAPVYDDNDQSAAPYVDCDMYEVGKMVANYAVKQIPENAEIAMLLGPAGNLHSELRQKGWDEVLATRPDIKVVDVQRGDWDTAEAMRITEDWLQHYPDLKAVASMNDSMILGTIEAEKAAGRELLTYGVDGMADGCNAVKEGMLCATALQDARELAKGALQLAKRAIGGEQLTGEDVYHVDAALITPENVDEFLAIHEGK